MDAGELVPGPGGMPMTGRLSVGEAHGAYLDWCRDEEGMKPGAEQNRKRFAEILAEKYKYDKTKKSRGVMRIPTLCKGVHWPSDAGRPALVGSWTGGS